MVNVANILYDLLVGGVYGLCDYLSAHVLLCLVPAFFIAGALAALLPKEAVIKYLGPETRRHISYPVAATSGLLIAVCSCTILPLFAGIWKKGAGLGPAVTFLFAGPAVNVLALVYTGSLIGMDIAIARAVLSIMFAILIGLLMAKLFKGEEEKGANKDYYESKTSNNPDPSSESSQGEVHASLQSRDDVWLRRHKGGVLFAALVGVLIAGTLPVEILLRLPLLFGFIAFVVVYSYSYFSRLEITNWMKETYFFVKMILPLLIIGVFIAGMMRAVLPENAIAGYVGSNTLQANFIAVLFGVFMYFPTLIEVPIARLFLDLGMHKGPLLAYLLADPVLSIQSVLVTRKIMGNKKNLVYVGLVTIFCTIAGLIFGFVVGVI